MYTELNISYIRNELARTPIIYSRGETLYHLGGYALVDFDPSTLRYQYSFNGTYGEYEVVLQAVEINGEAHLASSCSCPYPHGGCKHIVAAHLDLSRRLQNADFPEYQGVEELLDPEAETELGSIGVLTPEEIRETAEASRYDRAVQETLTLIPGDLFKGQHTVRNEQYQEYTVTIYDADEVHGHCTCPDFASNNLGLCKHLAFAHAELKKKRGTIGKTRRDPFPFIHLTWNSRIRKPVCFYEVIEDDGIRSQVEGLFTAPLKTGADSEYEQRLCIYTRESIMPLYELFTKASLSPDGSPLVFDDRLIGQMSRIFSLQELERIARDYSFDYSFLKTTLYPYQKEGVEFAAFRDSSLIADEMGLGKTLQAITTAVIKKQALGFTKVLIVSPASLKSQWEHEIGRFTDEQALVISGPREERKRKYLEEPAFFKITNYEAVLRDISTIEEWDPDFVILDEAQRIKNFETKTHRAINRIPRKHSLVITGTPLENRLEDLYSIMEFSSPELLTPLWAFAATHYRISRTKKNKIVGYRNLDIIHDKLKPILIRRTKREVFESLPEITENNFYLPLHPKQEEIHQGCMSSLRRLVMKKFLTPMDVRILQKTLLRARMVCDSTFLVDKKTNFSPKLAELSSILSEEVVGNGRKAVIFTEWTTMTHLVGRVLEAQGIRFVEFSGKVPVEKRQRLIDEFMEDPECLVFLSTDAGGVGLNLQNCDLLINVELPWNPAKLNQRIGRIHRIGQTSEKINVINLLSRNSIEERILASLSMKQDLFNAVIDGTADAVDFSREEQNRFLEQVRAMFTDDTEIGVPEDPEEFPEEELSPAETIEQETEELQVDLEAEESIPLQEEPAAAAASEGAASHTESIGSPEPAAAEAPSIGYDQLEAVLNQGLSFLNTLTAAATGKELFSADDDRKHVEIDREHGEVVLRFKL